MKFTLPLPFLLIGIAVSAQVSFNADSRGIVADINPAKSFIVAKAELTNDSDETLHLRWVKRLKEIPDGWKISVGDGDHTYIPEEDSRTFFMSPHETREMILFIYPNGFSGNGEVDLNIKNLRTEKILTKVTFRLNEMRTLQSGINAENVKLFPNPASDHFMIKSAINIGKIEIYNVIAERIRTIYSYQRQFLIDDLDPGMYFIRILGIDNQVIKTVRMRKH